MTKALLKRKSSLALDPMLFVSLIANLYVPGLLVAGLPSASYASASSWCLTGVLDLDVLDGANGFAIHGINGGGFGEVGDQVGWSVSSAGDVNADGIDDLLIGAPSADPNGESSGATYVLFGGASVGVGGALELANLDGSNGFALNGIKGAELDFGDRTGWSVSHAGDVNADGVDDLIMGAPAADVNGESSGQVYVVFGRVDLGASGSIELSGLDGSNGFTLNGVDSIDQAGVAVGKAGDVNADGIDDIIVGAIGASPNGGEPAGAAYVIFGASGIGASATLQLAELDGSNGFVVSGSDSPFGTGRSVSGAGDLNADGVDDIIVGAPSADDVGLASGKSFVVFGGVDVGAGGTLDLARLDGSNGFQLNGIDGGISGAGDRSGFSVSNAGDVNADGVDDVIIGAPFAAPNGRSSGESYVVFGGVGIGAGATFELASLDGSNGFVINGVDLIDKAGWSVSNAGDFNSDGVDDIIIGAFDAAPDGAVRAGKSYVVFGREDLGTRGSLELADLNASTGLVINATNTGVRTGFSVSHAGDVNGDGLDDIIIGDDRARPGGRNAAGASYVVFGKATVPEPSTVLLLLLAVLCKGLLHATIPAGKPTS